MSENHKAIVCTIKTKPHPNANRLQIGEVFGLQVIVGLDVKDGDIGLFFNEGLALSTEFATANDLLRRKDPVTGENSGGMFDANCRVRAQTFRGEKSEGFWCPLDNLLAFGDVASLREGDQLDEFNGVTICRKYFTKKTNEQIQGSRKERKGSLPTFQKHKDTEQLRFHYDSLQVGSLLILTEKTHGCLDANTVIDTLDGQKTIKDIVDNKLRVKVKSFDVENNEVIYVDIDDYYFFPNDDDWYEIELEDGTKLEITGNNPVWLPDLNCYRRVDELVNGDTLLKS